MGYMMRAFAQFVVAAACTVAMVGCSDVVAPTVADRPGSTADGGQIATVPVLLELGGVDGEVEKLEQAMNIYAGTGTETAALLLPAIQKVREAMTELGEGADRYGNINAHEAEKTFRKLILTYKPRGDAYSLKLIANTSAAGKNDDKHKEEIDILSYGQNDPANVEYQLFHVFNGAKLIMKNARVNDDGIDRAMAAVLAEIADLSNERP